MARNKTPHVTLYTGNRCSFCAQLRKFLQQYKVPFLEMNIERNQKALKQFTQLGGRGVPVLKVGDTVIHGYDPKQTRALLKEKKIIA